MSIVISSNMNLPVPSVGSEAGPDYAYDINSCLTLIDQHDHSPGRGVQITPNGLNINTALTFQSNFATNVAGVTLSAQGSPPANNTVYESGVDLYFVDGLGNNVRLTQSGAVAGTPGSIANLVPPASASYVAGSSTFVWQSDTSIAANMDFGAAIFRNLSPNSTFGVTVQAPSALANNYSITLPTIPGSISFLTLDTSGNIAASTPYPLTAAGIANSTITNNKFASGTQIPVTNTSITTTYTALITDGLIEAATSAPYTITLYSASVNPGLTLKIRKTSNDFNVLTVTDGSFTTTLNTQGETITIQSNGTAWVLLDRCIPSIWTSQANNITATTSNPTKAASPVTDKFWYRRVGENLEYRMEYSQTSAGSAGSGDYLFNIPSGITIDTTKCTVNTTIGSTVNGLFTLGSASAYIFAPTVIANGWMVPYNTSSMRMVLVLNSTTLTAVSSTEIHLDQSPVTYTAIGSLPITGWNG